jgi:P4 family phage/plasmid primase-like protien
VKKVYNFTDTTGLTREEIRALAEKLLEQTIPLPEETYEWLGSMLRYVRDKGEWLVYDNSSGLWHYELDDTALRSLLTDYFQIVFEEALAHKDGILQLYAKSMFSVNKVNQLAARIKAGIQFRELKADDLIEDVYNLRYFATDTGERVLIDIGQDEFNMKKVKFADTQPLKLTHISPVPIAVDYEEPKLWLQLIDEYMLHDPARVDYFKKVLAYMMSPYNYNQVLLYFIGSGRNGKSTIIKVLQDILGPYAMRMNAELLNGKPAPSFKKDDALAATEGRSLYIFNEIDERMVASTQNIKDLTEGGRDEFGNKVMTVVRPAYSRNYEINISGIPIIIANSLLNMGDWSNLSPIFKRLILVPFDYAITKEDPTILNRLAAEYPQIQAWLYLNYFEHKGVNLKNEVKPKDFQDLFIQYYEDSDILKMFWKECIDVTNVDSDRILRGTIYRMYEQFCKANGRKPIKNKGTNGFASLIKSYFPGITNVNGSVYVTGVKQSAYYTNEVVM